jgi:hypothetical protein
MDWYDTTGTKQYRVSLCKKQAYCYFDDFNQRVCEPPAFVFEIDNQHIAPRRIGEQLNFIDGTSDSKFSSKTDQSILRKVIELSRIRTKERKRERDEQTILFFLLIEYQNFFVYSADFWLEYQNDGEVPFNCSRQKSTLYFHFFKTTSKISNERMNL